jgi:hypothetical protein
MKNFFCLGLAVAIVFGVSLSEALARGGRGGAGRPGGGGRPEGFNQDGGRARGNVGGDRAGNKAIGDKAAGQKVTSAQNKGSQLGTNTATHNQPFSGSWYANHPNAWQAAHPHADAWAVASLGAASAWLGLGAANGADTTVVTGDTVDDSGDTADDDTDDESTSDPAAASQLAQSGSTGVTNDSEFLPLGVFALAPQSQKEATAMLQISISKSGAVRGSYFDVVSDEGHPVQGAIDKKTQRMAFTVSNGKTVFETQLTDLTQASGEVSLHFPDGTAADWNLVRYDAPVNGTVTD